VNVKVVLFDNGGLGLVRQQQTLFYKRQLFASEFVHRVDFCRGAEAMGIQAYDLSDDPNPQATLQRALTARGPALICASIHEDEMVYPMVPPGGANKDMIGGECHASATT
jgi:acetolactate synthase-1/2/3 large subunit